MGSTLVDEPTIIKNNDFDVELTNSTMKLPPKTWAVKKVKPEKR